MKRRFTSLALLLCAVLILFTLLPVTAHAETEGDWEYSVESGLATITKYNGTDAVVTIPEFVEDGLYRVTAIGSSAFANNVTMTQVDFPKALTSIGANAFEGCVGLTEITLPEKLTSLGKNAFLGCTKLNKITVLSTTLADNKSQKNSWGDIVGYDEPFKSAGTAGDGIEVIFADGCTRVPANMFYAYSGSASAPNILSVTLAESVTEIGANAFRNCTSVDTVNFGSVVTIGNSAFQGCTALTTFVWSEKLTTIGDSAFADCTKLEVVSLPRSLTTINANAFNGCTKLSSVTFQKGLTTIGDSAFAGCVSLTELTLPEKLTTLGKRAFEGCTKLAKITVLSTKLEDNKYYKNNWGDITDYDQPFYSAGTAGDGIEVIFADGCTRVPANMFYAYSGSDTAANIVSVTLAASVTEVGQNAFRDCADLKSVDFGKVVTIGSNAFYGCSALTDFVWSEKLTTIGSSAFASCTKLETVALPKSLTTIESSAFSDCTAMVSVTFPKGLTTIGESAFANCTSLTEVTLPEKLTTLGKRAFVSCTELNKITVLSTNLADNKYYKNNWGDIVDYDQSFYSAGTAGDGIEVIFADGCTRIPANMFYAYSGSDTAANLKSVTIADSVTEIGANAFRECADLSGVAIGNGMETIGSAAFQGCKELTDIDFGTSVTTIGNDAFTSCTALVKVTFPESLTQIGSYAFFECSKLSDISFPSSLTAIGEGAFKDCTAIVELTLPEKLSTLGKRAFESCTELAKITILSTKLEDNKYHKNNWGDITDYDQPFYSAGTAGDGIEVIFADGVTRIPANLFYAYSGVETAPTVTSVVVADTVTEVGSNAFTNCGDLSTIKFLGEAPTIADNAFTSVVCDGYHPGWAETALLDYGGDINWIGYVPEDTECEHTGTESKDAKDATCTEDGYTGDTICTACGETVTQGETIPATGHVNTETQNAKEATCTEDGYTGDTVCTACGETVTQGEVIPAPGHTEVVDEAVEATCEATGLTEGKHCSVCEEVLVEQEEVPKLEHTYEDGTCTECGEQDPNWVEPECPHTETETQNAAEATCTEDGYTGDTVCTACGETVAQGETIPAPGHTEVVDEAVEATCEATGLTEGKHCSVCEEVLVEQEEVPKLEHTYEDGTCTECGEQDPNWVEPECPHTETETQNAKEATCTEDGYTGDTVCTACGETVKQGEAIPAKGHDYEDGTCADCGEEEPEEPTVPDDDPLAGLDVVRIAGLNRFETAFDVADAMKENLGVEKFDAIIVASGTNFADALSGSYLAAVKNAPILLSFNEAYNDQAKNYIRENLNDNGTVYILGGPSAVPASMEVGLEGYTVKRLAGDDRFGTNLAILKEAGVGDKPILVCTGLSFADSLSASATELPILLVWKNLNDMQKAFLDSLSGNDLYIIGGESAVSNNMQIQVSHYGATKRVGGGNRFETSVLIAEEFFANPKSAVLAYALNYPDGLCGGALASTMDAPLILTMTKFEDQAAAYVQGEGITKGAVLGGTGLISDEAVLKIYGQTKAGEPDNVEDVQDTEVTKDDQYTLSSSETEVLAQSQTNVIFYVNSTLTIPYFELYCEGESTGIKLYDDGNYAAHMDDIPNDGCYTGMYCVDLSEEKDYSFTARAAVGAGEIETGNVEIFVYYELTDAELDEMELVDGQIQAILEQTKEENASASPDSLANLLHDNVLDYLHTLEAENRVYGIIDDPENYIISFKLSSGISDGVVYFEPKVDIAAEEPGVVGNQVSRDSNLYAEAAPTIASSASLDIEYITYREKALLLCYDNLASGWNGATLEDTTENLNDSLTDAGFSVDARYAVTVEDFKNMQDYDYIHVACHGTVYTLWTSPVTNEKTSVICTPQSATKATKKQYSADIKKDRIVCVGGQYYLRPSFFTHYYGEDPLKAYIVSLGCCKGAYTEHLSNALVNAGASAVLAYSDTVYTAYDYYMSEKMLEEMYKGRTVSQALSEARAAYGDDDLVWGAQQRDSGNTNFQTLKSERAECILSGNQEQKLHHSLLNGNFDGAFSLLSNGIAHWKEYGDARSIYRLSGIYPKSSPKMTIISSGFGSQNGATTSCIYQTCLIPENADTLTFWYDIVSEEPMEYVGSQYNDIFQVDILSTDGEILETVAFESVNSSSWYAVDGINFPDGDDTTYHTRWKSVETDVITKYQGKLVVLRFCVQDAGDAIYDTAALIDSVSIT